MTVLGVFGVLATAPRGMAVPITVNFDRALVEVVGEQPLPILLSGDPNNLRLRFHVPDAASIVSINSFQSTIFLYDDGDAGNNEQAENVFVFQVVPRSNIFLQYNGGLNGYTSGNPYALTANMNPGDLPDVLLEIQDDGYFLLRANRNGGDFFVLSATVTIDAELASVPEPATIGLIGLPLAMLSWLKRRQSLRS